MISELTQYPSDVKAWDDKRDSFTGEHWLVLGAGLALILAANRKPSSTTVRVLGSVLGSALLFRAASGRDGLAGVLPRLRP